MPLTSELKEAISQLPTKEKDWLLFRLLKKDRTYSCCAATSKSI